MCLFRCDRFRVFFLLLFRVFIWSALNLNILFQLCRTKEALKKRIQQRLPKPRPKKPCLLHRIPHEEVRSSNVIIHNCILWYRQTYTQRNIFTSMWRFLILHIIYRSIAKMNFFTYRFHRVIHHLQSHERRT